MSWAKFDDGAWAHRKILNAGNEAVGAWWRMICFCCANATDGVLSDAEALEIARRRPVLVKLIEVKLLDPLPAGAGYAVHNFGLYNPTGERARAAQAQRKEKARRAARVRWGDAPEHAQSDAPEHAREHAPEHPGGHTPGHPDRMLGASPDPRLPECPSAHALTRDPMPQGTPPTPPPAPPHPASQAPPQPAPPSAPPVWNASALGAIWNAAKLGVGFAADGWHEAEALAGRIRDTAAARGEAPEELAPRLLRAWPEMCAEWGRRNRAPRGRGPGKLNAHFGAVVEWLDGGGREAVQATRGPAPVSATFTHGKELT